ncbi:MAG TPA: cytochrome c [Polyangia bacterium]
MNRAAHGWGWLALTLLSTSGCETGLPSPDFERMLDQEKVRPYRVEPLLPGGAAMQSPPEGSVPYQSPEVRRARIDHPETLLGTDSAGADLAEVPLPVSAALLARGKQYFEILCAACHGPQGDGESEVARHMDQRKPPSLVDARVRAFAAGRIFRVIGEGYGLMPSYARVLDPPGRWAVVEYLRALQLSQSVALASLPADLRGEAEAALR